MRTDGEGLLNPTAHGVESCRKLVGFQRHPWHTTQQGKVASQRASHTVGSQQQTPTAFAEIDQINTVNCQAEAHIRTGNTGFTGCGVKQKLIAAI